MNRDKLIPRMTPRKYKEDPKVSGWFYIKKGESLTLSNGHSIPPSRSMIMIRLKDGLLHGENGPALVNNHKQPWLEFYLNGHILEHIKGIVVMGSVRFEDNEFKYDEDQACEEIYCNLSYMHSIDGPSATRWSKSGVFKNGKYSLNKDAKILKDYYHIQDKPLSAKEFYIHPEVIKHQRRLEIGKKLKIL